MASSSYSEEGGITDINVTPLVDVALVLLIIFMVATSVFVPPNMPVSLPRASNTEAPQPQSYGVTLGRQRVIYLNDRPIEARDLQTVLEAKVASQPDLQVVISADQGAAHGDVIHLLDLVRGSGVSRIAFAVDAHD